MLHMNTARTAIVVLEAVLLPIDVIFVGLRLWARRLKRTPLTLSDYCLIAGLVSDFA